MVEADRKTGRIFKEITVYCLKVLIRSVRMGFLAEENEDMLSARFISYCEVHYNYQGHIYFTLLLC